MIGDVIEDLLDVLDNVLYGSVQLHVTKNGSTKFVNQSADQLSEFGVPTEHVADNRSGFFKSFGWFRKNVGIWQCAFGIDQRVEKCGKFLFCELHQSISKGKGSDCAKTSV